MVNAEQVVIDIIANDKATSILENVRGKLIEINNLSSKYAQSISSINPNVGSKIPNPQIPQTPTVPNTSTPTVSVPPTQSLSDTTFSTTKNATKEVSDFEDKVKSAGKSGEEAGEKINKKFRVGNSTFHEFNNMLVTVGTQFSNLGTVIAGLFGANSFSGMIEKMWKGAAERQTNMLYLIHQRGVSQANSYYDEIMNIVAQLPGDDTFLTNILNMSAAMDKNLKVDNLKELGSAITDFYIASTMKGELPFETQKDLRKYLTTGDTKSLRNSLIANEIDLLKNKNSVLERGKALQEALDRNGFSGMSEYESATNELEEFKGHFQKAFADIGTIITSITQPILKLYNALDTLFGSRLSQAIILVATVLIGLIGLIGTGAIIVVVAIRNFEVLGQGLLIFSRINEFAAGSQGFLNAVIWEAVGAENAERIAIDGNVIAGLKKIVVESKELALKELHLAKTALSIILGRTEIGVGMEGVVVKSASTSATIEEISAEEAGVLVRATNIKTRLTAISAIIHDTLQTWLKTDATLAEAWAESVATESEAINTSGILANTTAKIGNIFQTISSISVTGAFSIVIAYNTVRKWMSTDASLAEAYAESVSTIGKMENLTATELNSLGQIQNVITKLKGILTTAQLTVVTIVQAIHTRLNTEATFSEALAVAVDTNMKIADTGATYGLATATAVLESELAPLIIPILLIAGAIVGLIIVIDKLGQAFGWWKDIGSMFEAISNGIGRLWNAFANSEVIQGIISYFQKFVASIQYVFESITGLFSKLFGWDEGDSGTFDIVQSIIDIFGKLGEVVKWVWDALDDFSNNNPIGQILTWLNPLGILLFHLDEIGSFFEDIGDAINRFTASEEFQSLMDSFGEVWKELQEPFQEIWTLIQEIMSIFAEAFGSGDPVGQGTEDRINAIVEVFKLLAFIIKVTIIPALRGIAFAIKIILLPIRVILTVIKAVVGAIQWATQAVDVFGTAWNVITAPLRVIQGIINIIGDTINYVSDAIKNSAIGKLFGWDKEDNNDKKSVEDGTKNNLYGKMRNRVSASDMDFATKHTILGELDKQNLTTNNVNNVRNLGRTYNNQNNQRQVIINQNFNEGSIPVDARNMTKKEARKMFIGAFGYNRSVGSKGILR